LRTLWTVAVVLTVVALQPFHAAAQVREATSAELIANLGKSEVERRRDAAYEFVRRQDASPEVIAALSKALSDNDNQVRFQAILALSRAGAKAEAAIPSLLKLLSDRDDQIRYRAGDALGKIGSAALEPLLKAWPDASSRSRIAIAQAFGILGSQATTAVPLLTEAIDEGKEGLPRYAAEALVAISSQEHAAFLKMAQHPDGTVRRIGISALAAITSPSENVTQELQKGVKDSEPKIRETAIIALAKSSLPATEKSHFIESALLDETPSVRAAAIVAMRKASLPKKEFANRIALRLKDTDASAASAIVKALGMLGSDAIATLPTLLEISTKEGVDQSQISETLASFGGAAVPDLLASIEKQPTLEAMLSQALALIGEPAINALVPGLSSDSELIRVAAARALGGMRPLNKALVEKLSAAVKDNSPTVRQVAVNALVAANKDAANAKNVLLESTRDDSPEVRTVAIQALPIFDYSPEEIQGVLSRGLSDTSPAVKASAAMILAQLPKFHRGNVDKIIALVGDENPQVRKVAVQSFAKFDKDLISDSLVQACVVALADSDHSVRIAATETAKTLKLSQPAVLDALAANLIEDLDLLRASLEAISGFGPKASALISPVSALISHDKADVRAAAVTALAEIDTDPQQLTGRLTEALDDKEWEVRRVAGVALGKIGPPAKNAVPKLFRMLSHEEDTDFASGALREINDAPVEAIPLFIEKLDSEERRVGFYAVTLLGKIGPPAAEALPKLEEMLANPNSGGGREAGRSDFRRKYLRDAIAAIKGEAKEEEKK
jgi:HEAT repeat protein